MKTLPVATIATLALAVGLTLTADAGAAVYWTNKGQSDCFAPNGSIGRANLDGTLVDQKFITGADVPRGVAVNSADIFWSNQGPCDNSVGGASLDGSVVDQLFIAGNPAGPAGPTGIAADDFDVFWSNLFGGDRISAAALDGSSVEPAFITGTSGACSLALDADWVYWANSGINTANPDG